MANILKKNKDSLSLRLVRFGLGLFGLGLFYWIIISGYTPPGICGEVLRHNRENNIDASPLFYSEVEHMRELEEGVQILRKRFELKLNR